LAAATGSTQDSAGGEQREGNTSPSVGILIIICLYHEYTLLSDYYFLPEIRVLQA
jgi:hypothetical protein